MAVPERTIGVEINQAASFFERTIATLPPCPGNSTITDVLGSHVVDMVDLVHVSGQTELDVFPLGEQVDQLGGIAAHAGMRRLMSMSAEKAGRCLVSF